MCVRRWGGGVLCELCPDKTEKAGRSQIMKHLIWHDMLRCGNLILRSLGACFATENKLFLNYT